MKHLLSFFAITFFAFNAKSQNVGIGTTTPATILDVTSTTQGVLIPRVTQAQMIAIPTPANGLLVTNTDSANRIFVYTGTEGWKGLSFTGESNGNSSVDTALLVHKAGAETITGSKTFIPDLLVNGILVGKGGGNVATNTAFGSLALVSNSTGTENTANGASALLSNTTGSENVAIGAFALGANTVGINNTAIGDNALRSNTSGSYNTASGHHALFNNTTGLDNVAIGDNALYYNTTGSTNNASGDYSLFNNTSGTGNSAKGDASLYSNTTGGYNVANGVNSLFANTTGSENTAIGTFAGFLVANTTNNTVADNSIFLGARSKALASGQTNQIVIGHDATGLGSNTAIIGNSLTTTTGISGKLFLATGLNVAPLSATDTGVTGEIRITATFIYVCIATNVWVRSPLTTW